MIFSSLSWAITQSCSRRCPLFLVSYLLLPIYVAICCCYCYYHQLSLLKFVILCFYYFYIFGCWYRLSMLLLLLSKLMIHTLPPREYRGPPCDHRAESQKLWYRISWDSLWLSLWPPGAPPSSKYRLFQSPEWYSLYSEERQGNFGYQIINDWVSSDISSTVKLTSMLPVVPWGLGHRGILDPRTRDVWNRDSNESSHLPTRFFPFLRSSPSPIAPFFARWIDILRIENRWRRRVADKFCHCWSHRRNQECRWSVEKGGFKQDILVPFDGQMSIYPIAYKYLVTNEINACPNQRVLAKCHLLVPRILTNRPITRLLRTEEVSWSKI